MAVEVFKHLEELRHRHVAEAPRPKLLREILAVAGRHAVAEMGAPSLLQRWLRRKELLPPGLPSRGLVAGDQGDDRGDGELRPEQQLWVGEGLVLVGGS